MNIPSWDDLRILLEVHRRQSFLAAGAQLGLSTATVARRIHALEKAVARPLVQRTSRGTFLEKEALAFVRVAEETERSLRAQWRDAGGASPFAGTVRISVPDGFGPPVAATLAPFLRQHAETQVELISELRYVDLASREADVGIRGGRSKSPVLIERFIGEVHAAVHASEAYLERALPKRALAAADFAAQDFIVEDSDRNVFAARGATRFPLRSNSYDTRVQGAEDGLGLLLLARETAKNHPKLLPVRLETPMPPLRFYLTFHKDLRAVPRVRGVAEALMDGLRQLLKG